MQFLPPKPRHILWVLVSFLFVLFTPMYASAAPRAVPFTVGETLDPGLDAQPCGPSDANCFPAVLETIDENTSLETNTRKIRFVGAGVTATTLNGTTTVTIPGAGGIVLGLIGTTSNAYAMSLNGGELQLELADATNPGIVGTGTQTFSGVKTFSNNTIFNGNVGIGTSSPYAKLSVVGQVVSEYFTATSTTATSTLSGGLNIANGGLLYDFSSGNVGIGTRNPSAQLYVPGKIPSAAIGTVSTGDDPRAITVQGNYAYVVNVIDDTLNIFDITVPTAPVRVGSTTAGNGPVHVIVNGEYAYVTNTTDDTIQVFDVSNPTLPRSVTLIPTDDHPHFMQIRGKYLYLVTLAGYTLQIFDIGNPISPVAVSRITTGDAPIFIDVDGRYAYITSANALEIYDIANPKSPALVGMTFTSGANPRYVDVQDRYAYVTNQNPSSFEVIDISNPASPTGVGNLPLGSDPNFLSVKGRYAYFVDRTSNVIYVIDIIDPSAPLSIGSIPTGGGSSPRFLFVSGRYLYVTYSGLDSLNIFDLGGAYLQGLEAGNIEVTSIAVKKTLELNGSGIIRGSLGVNGLSSTGAGSFSLFSQSSLEDVSALSATVMDSNSSSLADVFSIEHMASSTSLSGIGAGLLFKNEDASGMATSTGRISSVLTSNSTTSPTSALLFYNKNSSGALSEFMRLDHLGRLGIGTSSPYAKLSVAGRVVAESYVATSTTASSTFFNLYALSASTTNLAVSGSFFQDTFTDCTGAGNKVTYTLASGKFGCDTDQTGGASLNTGNATFGNLTATTSLTANLATIGSATIGTFTATSSASTTNLIVSGTATTSNLVSLGTTTLALNGGNVGIGTSSPYAKLSVVGNSYLGGLLTLGTSSLSMISSTGTLQLGIASGTTQLYFTNNGFRQNLSKRIASTIGSTSVSTWTMRAAAANNAWRDIAWSPELGIFAAVSSGGSDRVMTSPDGVNWTSRSAASASSWQSLTWAPSLGLFVAVGLGTVMTSPDGITWTTQTPATADSWYAITWSPELKLLVAIGFETGVGTPVTMTSANGVAWTSQSNAGFPTLNSAGDIVWAAELGLFVAVSDAAEISTSPDGINWIGRSPGGVEGGFVNIAWSPELGRLVISETAGAGGTYLHYSSDGINWNTVLSPEWANYNDVAWSPELGMFVMVSSVATNYRIITSPDGIVWTGRTAPEAKAWTDIVWSPELGIFVALSQSGTGNRVMTSGSYVAKSNLSSLLAGTIGVGTSSPWAQLSITSYATSTPALYIGATNTPYFTVTGGGKTGVGTTSPWGQFSINISTTSFPAFFVGSSTGASFIINGNGNVGIGTTSPYAKLSVTGQIVGEYFSATSTSAISSFMGRVGIGTSSPNESVVLDVEGDVQIGTSTTGCLVDADGTNLAGTCSSDATLKTDIVAVEESLLNQVLGLQVFNYRWLNNPTGELQLGLIAQQAESVAPKLVLTEENGLKKVHFEYLPFYTIKALQELDLKIETLGSSTAPETEASGEKSFLGRVLARMKEWLGSATNGIAKIFTDEVEVKNLCLSDESGKTCVTKSQLDALLQGAVQVIPPPAPVPPTSSPEPENIPPEEEITPPTPPETAPEDTPTPEDESAPSEPPAPVPIPEQQPDPEPTPAPENP